MTSALHSDDILRWPDGSWCYRYELPEMAHKSDDYEVLSAGSAAWNRFHIDEDLE